MDIDLKQPDWVTEAENNNEWFPPEPDEETELINFLLSPYLTSHICCGNYEAMKRGFLIIVNRPEGKDIYKKMASEISICQNCVQKYLKGKAWIKSQLQGESRHKLSKTINSFDIERIINQLPSGHQKSLELDSIYIEKKSLALYEVMLCPWILDDSNFFVERREKFYQSLITWKPLEEPPFLTISQLFPGIMWLESCLDKKVVQWAHELSWTGVNDETLMEAFNLYFQRFSSQLSVFIERKSSSISQTFNSPPLDDFYLTFYRILTKIPAQLLIKIFKRQKVLGILSNKLLHQDVPKYHSNDIFRAIYAIGPQIWNEFEKDALQQAKLILSHTTIPSLHKDFENDNVYVETALNNVLAFVNSIGKLPKAAFLELLELVGEALQKRFKAISPPAETLKNTIKLVCKSAFTRSPPESAPLSLKTIWTSLIDFKSVSDSHVLRSAMIAEAKLIRMNLVHQIHSANPRKKNNNIEIPNKFSQQAIIFNVIQEPNTNYICEGLFVHCAPIVILNDSIETNKKTLSRVKDVLKNIFATKSSFFSHPSKSTLSILLDSALYWFVCPSLFESASIFYTSTILQKIETDVSVLSCYLRTNLSAALISARLLLMDVIAYEFDACDEIWENLSNCLFQMIPMLESSAQSEDVTNLLVPIWIYCRHILTPVMKNGEKSFRKLSAIRPTLLVFQSILRLLRSNRIIEEAMKNASSWLPVILQLPDCIGYTSPETLAVWRSTTTNIFSILRISQKKLSQDVLDQLLRLESRGLILRENWTSLFEADQIPPSLSPEKKNQPQARHDQIQAMSRMISSANASSQSAFNKASSQNQGWINYHQTTAQQQQTTSSSQQHSKHITSNNNLSGSQQQSSSNLSKNSATSNAPKLPLKQKKISEILIVDSDSNDDDDDDSTSSKSSSKRRNFPLDHINNSTTTSSNASSTSHQSPFATSNSSKQSHISSYYKPPIQTQSSSAGPTISSLISSSTPKPKTNLIPSSSHSMSMNESRLKKHKVYDLDPVVETMSFQERKEKDAEIVRLQKAKEKKAAEAAAASALQRTISQTEVIAPKIDRAEMNRQKEIMAKNHVKFRRGRSIDDLQAHILKMNFADLSFPSDVHLPVHMLPSRFRDVEEYVAKFEPLLLLEIQAQMKQSKSEPEDDEIHVRQISSIGEVGQFRQLGISKINNMAVHDVLLIWKVPPNQAPYLPNFQRDPKFPHCLGIVDQASASKNHEQVVRIMVDASTNDHRQGIHSTMTVNSEWAFKRIFRLATACREWQALETCDSLHFIKEIVDPAVYDNRFVSANNNKFNPQQVANFTAKLSNQRLFNDSQRRAISNSIVNPGINFIQGPPGTGKTKTLTGILSILLALQQGPILVCTPSNSAIDEIASRILSNGLYNISSSTPEMLKHYRLVRVGTHAAIPESVNAVSLEAIAKKEYEKLKDSASSSNNTGFKTARASKDDFATAYLKKADIVCSTLSASGSALIQKSGIEFKTVIIDEAAQAVELSTLIPMQYGCQLCIMIGDPQQLPATVFSKAASECSYERSLFGRFAEVIKDKDRISMLDIQYRMHPTISAFPRKHFYQSKLLDGEKSYIPPWHHPNLKIFGPLMFFDLAKSDMSRKEGSLSNETEVAFIVGLLQTLVLVFPAVDFSGKIAVITPYQKQKANIIYALNIAKSKAQNQKTGDTEIDSRNQRLTQVLPTIEVSTIDGYQGKEKEIIIFSTVRSYSTTNTVGFLADVRRMNVALTRAKDSLWVIGQSSALRANSEWSQYLNQLKQENKLSVSMGPEEFWSGIFKKKNH